jgi:hypothetical protein
MNNICVFNGNAGINAPGDVDSPTLGNNNVYANGENYAGGVVADASDISMPPGFVGTGTHPYHLGAGTSCVDAGDNTAPGLPATDILGNARIYGSFVDIGCYEWSPGGLPVIDHFDFSAISSPQDQGTNFPVTITAKTSTGATVTDFDGTATLTALTAPIPNERTIGYQGHLSDSRPLGTDRRVSRSQVIYLASELGVPMTIESLALDVVTIPGQTLNNWTIRMKHTSLSEFPAPAQWDSSGWAMVYQANETVSSTDWVTFNFSTPFTYNGTDNLMVDFSFSNASETSAGFVRIAIPSGYRAIYRGFTSDSGDPLTWSGGTPSPNRSTYTPNIRLGGSFPEVFDMAPAVTDAFVGGVWTGNVSVLGRRPGVFLNADDGNGHTGQSNSFDIEGPLFVENFEDGDIDGWIDAGGGGTEQVTTFVAAEGTHSLYISGQGGLRRVITGIQPSHISFYVRSYSTTTTDGYFIVGNESAYSDIDEQVAFFYMSSSGSMILIGGTSLPYTANQWYQVDYYLDWGARTFDYYVDSTLINTGVPFRGALADSIAEISVRNSYNPAETRAWWDGIVMDP